MSSTNANHCFVDDELLTFRSLKSPSGRMLSPVYVNCCGIRLSLRFVCGILGSPPAQSGVNTGGYMVHMELGLESEKTHTD